MLKKDIVLIPARLNSVRLPKKALADIWGRPMIVRVADSAVKSGITKVVIATDHVEIARVVENFGYEAVMTSAAHSSGSDRVYEALEKIDPDKEYGFVVNLQGDLLALNPLDIHSALSFLKNSDADIVTMGVKIRTESKKDNPNVVKIVASPFNYQKNETQLLAHYFTRARAPWGDGPHFEHIGLYAYRRESLERFTFLPQSDLEKRERLEQLRAISNGMRLYVQRVSSCPISVDTAEDLHAARILFKKELQNA